MMKNSKRFVWTERDAQLLPLPNEVPDEQVQAFIMRSVERTANRIGLVAYLEELKVQLKQNELHKK